MINDEKLFSMTSEPRIMDLECARRVLGNLGTSTDSEIALAANVFQDARDELLREYKRRVPYQAATETECATCYLPGVGACDGPEGRCGCACHGGDQ